MVVVELQVVQVVLEVVQLEVQMVQQILAAEAVQLVQ